MEIILAQPRGFCAGVVRAIEIVEQALEIYGPPIYVLHEIVHNQHVVADLRRRGAIFTEDLSDIPSGAVTIFSAHGVSAARVEEARSRQLDIIDATCPLVAKIHLQAQKYSQEGLEVVIVGHPGHPEVEGTRGRIPGPVHVVSKVEDVWQLNVTGPEHVAYVTQTTLSVDDTRDVILALQQRFPNIRGRELDGICYATQNRQNAVRKLVKDTELLLVVGARNSSNSNRLREVGEQAGLRAHLVQDASELDMSWFSPGIRVGITAGASTPERLVQEVIHRLAQIEDIKIHELEADAEDVTFRLPITLLTKQIQSTSH
ncbi:MAG: 4-hydroxy-3-methylbut-2-enyl diphosphate reductase [Pseudomonadota bacterium]|nr:4-hydroxy-3-methylbut-2-enyl diphosphate reductase [Pseudomonadota bacterium]